MTTFRICLRITSLLAALLPVFAAGAADLPPLPKGLSAPANAIRMQAFNLPTVAGGNVKADDFKDKVVIARFWATW